MAASGDAGNAVALLRAIPELVNACHDYPVRVSLAQAIDDAGGGDMAA